MRVISDVDKIQQAVGWHPIDDLLAPAIHLDGPKMVTPVLVEGAAGTKLLARQQETGNLQALGAADALYFERYVTLDGSATDAAVYDSLGAALADLSKGEPVEVGVDLPYGRYLKIMQHVDVYVSGEEEPRPVFAACMPAEEILQRFAHYHALGREAARRLVEARDALAPLAVLLEPGKDTRFTLLDAFLADLGLDALLATAPIDVRELTAESPEDDWAVLKVRGDGNVYLLTPQQSSIGSPVGSFPSLAEAVARLSPGHKLAVEETYVSVGLAGRLQAAGLELVPFSAALSKWREYRDEESIPFSIIAAQASRYAVDSALAFAEKAIVAGREITERDVYQRYLELVRDFQRELGSPFKITPFFVNCHAGNRTIYPSRPVDHALSGESNSLKLDAGLTVSIDGVVLGTSDIARTLTTTPQGKEAYRTFLGIVRHVITHSLVPGRRCEDIHRDLVEAMDRCRDRLIEIGMLPPEVELQAIYGRRNVGHLMGKQESFVTEFRPGDTDMLRAGAVGAVEIQWPRAGHSIAAEDMWVLTPTGAHLLTI
jgi:Xaa-Pro aminopeptidase